MRLYFLLFSFVVLLSPKHPLPHTIFIRFSVPQRLTWNWNFSNPTDLKETSQLAMRDKQNSSSFQSWQRKLVRLVWWFHFSANVDRWPQDGQKENLRKKIFNRFMELFRPTQFHVLIENCWKNSQTLLNFKKEKTSLWEEKKMNLETVSPTFRGDRTRSASLTFECLNFIRALQLRATDIQFTSSGTWQNVSVLTLRIFLRETMRTKRWSFFATLIVKTKLLNSQTIFQISNFSFALTAHHRQQTSNKT